MLQFLEILFTIFSLGSVLSSPIILPNNDAQNFLTTGTGQAALDVRTTIEEVQKMLASNHNLPRLTRGEIEDLFEEVTREEYEKSLIAGDFTRAKHMRALMLVLPYNTDNLTNDNLQEIYNLPPVTQVVSSAEVRPQRMQKIVVPSGKVEIISVDNIDHPTTYKPFFKKKTIRRQPNPTTYHPNSEFVKTPKSTTTTTTTTATTTTTSPILFIRTTSKSISEEKHKNSANTNNRFSSHYNAKKDQFNKDSIVAQKTTTKQKITPELEDILESLGFAAQSQSRKRFKLEEEQPQQDDLPRPVISSLIKQDRISIDEFRPYTETLNVEDFRKSLIPEIKPEDYIAFKPLPISNESPKNIEPELESYLKIFGIIGERNSRSRKLIELDSDDDKESTKITISTTTPVPSSTRPARIKRIDTNIEENIQFPIIGSTSAQDNIDEEDYEQLHKLLNNIRQLQQLNSNLTVETIKTLDLRNYNFSQTLLSQGPDPIENADSDDPLKNEIKRQSDTAEPTRFSLQLSLDTENDSLPADVASVSTTLSLESTSEIPSINTAATTTTASTADDDAASAAITTTTTTTTATPTTSSTEGSRRADSIGLDDDTFGGLDPVTEEPLPPPRKNGFYFLADWNSFLEVGDGDEKVVVKFNPKIGDPGRFIPVTVP